MPKENIDKLVNNYDNNLLSSNRKKLIKKFLLEKVKLFEEIFIEEELVCQKESRRHNSINSMEEAGFQFKDINDDIEVKVEEAETTDEVKSAIKTLLKGQQDLIEKVFYKNMKLVDIAAHEGVTEAAIRNRLNKVYKKLKKVLN